MRDADETTASRDTGDPADPHTDEPHTDTPHTADPRTAVPHPAGPPVPALAVTLPTNALAAAVLPADGRPAAALPADGLPAATVRTRVTVPLRFGDGFSVTADLVTFHGLADGQEHVAMILGEVAAGRPPLVRLHSECLTGDVFGSARCDCGPQLREAVERIAEHGGVLLYLRQEGRGIGLYNKLDAYALQDQGLDTYEANAALGLPEDARDYTAAGQMLRALGIDALDLLSNNPDKAQQLRDLGLTVTHRVPTGVFTTAQNVRYLRAKVVHTQHTLPLTELTELTAG